MEQQLLNLLMTAAKPPWNYVIAGVAITLFVIPKLLALPNALHELRSERRLLRLEKERLELLKLRYEIEAIKKQHGLSDLAIDKPQNDRLLVSRRDIFVRRPESAPASESPVPVFEIPWLSASIPRLSPAPLWMRRLPDLAAVSLLVSQGFLGLVMVSCIFASVTLPLIMYSEPVEGFGWRDTAIVVVIYVLLTASCYAQYKKVRRWRHELRAGVPAGA